MGFAKCDTERQADGARVIRGLDRGKSCDLKSPTYNAARTRMKGLPV